MSSLVMTLTETLRYRGAVGQWSWVLHRVSGLGVVLFLMIHIIDTSWSVFYPRLYEEAIAVYQTPLFTIGEFALVACVIYHAYNGLRIVLMDFTPRWWRYQQRAAYIVLGATALTLLPVFVLMFNHVLHYYDSDPTILGLDKVIESMLPFVGGGLVAIGAALVFSVVTGVFVGNDSKATKSQSKTERFWWSFMRISGILIIPLVFGHLGMIHIIQGVFEMTVANGDVVGVVADSNAAGFIGNAINDTGTAVEFVGERWNYLLASIAIWRLFDFALLALAVVHGFNGMRYVLTDFTMSNATLRRASVYVCVIGVVILLVMGAGALLGTIDDTAIEMAIEAQHELGLR